VNQEVPVIRKLVARLRSERAWYGLALALDVALLAVLGAVAPQQLPVVLYKVTLCLLAGVAGYCLDRVLFVYADPAGYLCRDHRETPGANRPGDADYPVVRDYLLVFGLAMLRQAMLVTGAMLCVGLGL
jgi:hypothetical protein